MVSDSVLIESGRLTVTRLTRGTKEKAGIPDLRYFVGLSTVCFV